MDNNVSIDSFHTKTTEVDFMSKGTNGKKSLFSWIERFQSDSMNTIYSSLPKHLTNTCKLALIAQIYLLFENNDETIFSLVIYMQLILCV